MSFIVRHKTTGHFLKGRDEWTHHPNAALQFNNGLKLVDYLERGNVRTRTDFVEVIVFPGGTPPGTG